jgi:hypothetical protein
MASAGLASVGRYKIGGLISVESIFAKSQRFGQRLFLRKAA